MNRICPCSKPPGGTITCRIDQLAICGIVDGEVKKECIDPPGGLAHPQVGEASKQQALANWILSQILTVYRDSQQDISADEMTILRSGQYVNPDRNTNVRFVVPEDMDFTEIGKGEPVSATR